ncbi:hypothetical protein CEQ90_16790 [Lewinellaceae bacterium SD302]|nr:hypothetical protein CEQ90_16790 [Lewinellaceae bacterium SD302]
MPLFSKPPPVRLPASIDLPKARRWTLSNGLDVVAIGGAKTPILRVEMIFNAGRPFETGRLVARATNQLLNESTRQRDGAELEDFFEFYGTSLQTPNVFDTGHVAVYTILPHLEKILPVFAEVIAEPAFNKKDFKTFVRRSKQDLREDLTDPDTLAYRHFTEQIFGADHPYGYNSFPKDYDKLDLSVVRDFHASAYVANNATLLVSGMVTDKVAMLLEKHLGQLPKGQKLQAGPFSVKGTPGIYQLHRPKASQTMIRRGIPLFPRSHPDYPGLTVLNTLFGGYFGSRLMRNIREEKGYTYGIDSSVDFMRFGGYLTIGADVANENLALVRGEIDREIDKIRTDLVPDQELDTTRAYLLGSLLHNIDGPLNTADRYQMTIIEATDADHFPRLVDTIRHINPAELRELAQRYLGTEQEREVIVGGAEILEGAVGL